MLAGESVRSICKTDGMPDRTTLYGWLADQKNPEFFHQYREAISARAYALAEECLDVSDGKEGSSGDVQRDKLMVDTRRWMSSRLLPKVYGDKVEIEHGGRVAVTSEPASVEAAREVLRAAGLDS